MNHVDHKVLLARLLTPDVNSWNDLFQKLLNLPNDPNLSQAGSAFEWFAKYYFQNTGEYQDVFHYSEIGTGRGSLRERLILPKRDKGIDLLLISKSGGRKKHIAVQCKFRKEQSSKLGWGKDELSHLIAHSSVDQHFVFSNASGVDKDVEKQGRELQVFLFGDLLDLTKSDFDTIRKKVSGKKAKSLPRAFPRKDQMLAINKVYRSFKTSDRGQLILPCGAGKTLTALWIKEQMRAKKVLVLVPSLALLRQVKNEWVRHRNSPFEYLCVCSERDIDSDSSDAAIGSVFELGHTGLGVTTDPKQIQSAMISSPNLVVFCTYQSSPELSKALKGRKTSFDLAICDEAHRTASRRTADSAWVVIHDQSKIPCKKRLYMTATPKIADPNLYKIAREKQGRELDFYLAEMGNKNIFGAEFHRQSFSEAIKAGILVDYRIISVGLSNSELRDQLRSYTNRPDITYEDLAHNLVIKKVMNEHKIKHLITYHSTIKSAKRFADDHKKIDPKCLAAYVTGEDSTSDRARILEELLVQSEKGVVSNARCLTEGIDIPTIEAVYFCDPKHSSIDIVQASGRALRISRNPKVKKKFGFIFVPTFHDDEKTVEEQIQNGAWDNLIRTVRALSDHDDRIQQRISNIIWGKPARGRSRKESLSISVHGQIVIEGFKKKIQQDIFFQVLRKTLDVPFRPFDKAREFVRSLGLRSADEWRQYRNGLFRELPQLPQDIPSNPNSTYKNLGWKNWGDWFGTGYVSTSKRDFRSFAEARNFVHSLRLKSELEWRKYRKGDLKHKSKLPKDIPTNPNRTYKKEWNGMGDWLGTKYVATSMRKYRTFKSARAYVQSLGLASSKQWREYTKGQMKGTPRLPHDIPADPSRVYKNQGWSGFGDWLGSGIIAARLRKYRPFLKARSFVRSLRLTNQKTWLAYTKGQTGKRPALPKDIPANPGTVYSNKGWRGLGDWLGTDNVAPRYFKYRNFNNARQFARKLKLKSRREWISYTKGNLKKIASLPSDISASPHKTYKNKGWKGYGDWLGTGTIAPHRRKFRSFQKARKHARSLKLKNQNDWFLYTKGQLAGKRKLPSDIPANPSSVYSGKGWISYGDWLGTGNIAPQRKVFWSFKKSRAYIRKLKIKSESTWRIFCKSGKKPNDIPTNPSRYYKDLGWKGWADWLGRSSK